MGKTRPYEQGRQQADLQRGSRSLFDSLWCYGMSFCFNCNIQVCKFLPFTYALVSAGAG